MRYLRSDKGPGKHSLTECVIDRKLMHIYYMDINIGQHLLITELNNAEGVSLLSFSEGKS